MKEIKRNIYLNKLIERKENDMIKVITGIRRCGKSFLLNELFVDYLVDCGVDDNHIIRLSLEGVQGLPYREFSYTFQYLTDLMTDKKMYYIILDEIQMMDDFVELLNGLLQIKNVDVYVTGSNSRFLSSDIATEFRGRGDVIQMHPLRFAEFLSVYEGDRQDAWYDYFTYGGLPQLFTYFSEESKVDYLKTIFETTYKSDILERNKIKHGSLHTLRHTFATRLFKNGVDIKVISELLGHSDISITYDIYTHVIQSQKKKAVDVLDNL